eukprot:355744-Chlamydomonas_euryale.AAC.8
MLTSPPPARCRSCPSRAPRLQPAAAPPPRAAPSRRPAALPARLAASPPTRPHGGAGARPPRPAPPARPRAARGMAAAASQPAEVCEALATRSRPASAAATRRRAPTRSPSWTPWRRSRAAAAHAIEDVRRRVRGLSAGVDSVACSAAATARGAAGCLLLCKVTRPGRGASRGGVARAARAGSACGATRSRAAAFDAVRGDLPGEGAADDVRCSDHFSSS